MAKLLVIDDEPGIRELLDTLLSRKGYDVILADSGQKGLEVFCRARTDVVVLDLKMPGMDGLTVPSQSHATSHHFNGGRDTRVRAASPGAGG